MMTSYGGIIRIRLRVEGHTFLSACLSKLPCGKQYSTTVDSCQFKEKYLIKNLNTFSGMIAVFNLIVLFLLSGTLIKLICEHAENES